MSDESPPTSAAGAVRFAPHEDRPLGLWSASLTTLISILWAGTAVGTIIAADSVPPMILGALRFATTMPVLWLWCRWEGSRLGLSRAGIVPTTVLGAMLFVQIWTFNVAIDLSSSSHGAVIINTFLFWVAGYEHFVSRTNRLTGWQLLGMLVAFAGVLLLFSQSSSGSRNDQPDPATLGGDLLMLLSSIVLAVKVIYTKHAVRTVEPGPLMLWHNVVGMLLFAIGGLLFEDVSQVSLPSEAVWSILYVGVVVSGFCFAAHAWLLLHHSAGSVSVFSFLTPVVAVLMSNLLRGDQLTSSLLLCGACVATGIALVNWPRKQSTSQRQAQEWT